MQCLVGAYNGLLHWDGSEVRVVREGVHYGVTWDHGYIYASYNPQHEPVSRIEVYDSRLNYLDILPISDLQSVHQIYWYDGVLYITNTAHDRIAAWNGVHTTRWDYKEDLPLKVEDALVERLHINSIWTDGVYWYVCEHGYKYPPPRIRVFDMECRQVQVMEMDVAVHDDLNAHNVYLDDEYMYICRHRRIDIRDHAGNLVRSIFPHGDDESTFLLRGLARTAEHFYVGESTYAPRELRGEGDSDILILDKDLNLLDTIPLKGVGQVYDIRVTDEIDYAHNGVPYPMV
uniref:Uncharacterized protein n=1 Tax=viral metagenome TaxID=1070528 RepID=A0A6M3MAU5_9ZZZZ